MKVAVAGAPLEQIRALRRSRRLAAKENDNEKKKKRTKDKVLVREIVEQRVNFFFWSVVGHSDLVAGARVGDTRAKAHKLARKGSAATVALRDTHACLLHRAAVGSERALIQEDCADSQLLRRRFKIRQLKHTSSR